MKEPIRKIELAGGRVRYRVVVDVGLDPATGKRRQVTSTHDTLKAARAWLAQTRTDATKGTFVARERTTVADYLDGWLAGRVDLKPSTRRNYEDALKVVRDSLGQRSLQDLAKADLDRLVAGMLDGSLRRQGTKGRPLSPRAVRLTLTVLSQALDAAVAEGRLVRNVASLVKRPKDQRADKAVWEPEHVATFLASTESALLGPLFRLSLHGLRRGEVCGLRWEDVDLEAEQVTVRHARVLVAGLGVVEGDTKSSAGQRTVWLGPETTQRLEGLRRAQREQGQGWRDEDLVALDAAGQPLRPDWYSDAFTRAAKAAGVPPVSLHGARHGFVSYLLHQGVPVAVVQRLVGHADAAVTLGVYTHALETGSRASVREALAAVGL